MNDNDIKCFRVVHDLDSGVAFSGETSKFSELAEALCRYQGKREIRCSGGMVDATDHVAAADAYIKAKAADRGSERLFWI